MIMKVFSIVRSLKCLGILNRSYSSLSSAKCILNLVVPIVFECKRDFEMKLREIIILFVSFLTVNGCNRKNENYIEHPNETKNKSSIRDYSKMLDEMHANVSKKTVNIAKECSVRGIRGDRYKKIVKTFYEIGEMEIKKVVDSGYEVDFDPKYPDIDEIK